MSKKITHTSNRGTPINMEEMRLNNESTVAVTGRDSKVAMNARGDTLARGGTVYRRREDIDAEYNRNLQGKVKRVDIRDVQPDEFITPAQIAEKLGELKAHQEQKKVEKSATPGVDSFAPEKPAAPRAARRLSEKDD